MLWICSDEQHMLLAKVTQMPLVVSPILSKNFGTLLKDGFEYQSTVGALQYLTRPSISYVVNKACCSYVETL